MSIPVTKISKGAFSNCLNLQFVEMQADSQLQIIDEFAFACTSIQSITTPWQVTKIGESAFEGCV